ncbi:MAG: DUF5597 domain-containing protein, partial [Bacteroides sp.]|nr:DUF5597 domain-containing protein [Bacteroides sp.]
MGGESGNSTAASLDRLEKDFPKLRRMGLNTVLIPAYWELIEPREGEFDFTLIDGAVRLARQNDLKLVFLWFGVWKNSMSCYAPLWAKEDSKRFPRAYTREGKPLEIMSAFSDQVLKADMRAFSQFMKHLAETDKEDNTVIMVQVENEIGMLEDARDHSKEANKHFRATVPIQLTDYLKKNKNSLHPVFKQRWDANGSKTQGTWTDLFGEGPETDEIFMAWSYGVFIQQLAAAGKEMYDLPMYLNAALNSRGRRPGAYPSAGPLAHLIDVWRAAAPAIDFIAPDIYDPGFAGWAAQYHISGNPLFIPEIKLEDANAARVFYAFGEHDAMGFSPFYIEDSYDPENNPLTQSYTLLRQLLSLLVEKQGKGLTNGLLFEEGETERVLEKNGFRFICRHDYTLGWAPQAKDGSEWPASGAVIIELSPTEYLIGGTGV